MVLAILLLATPAMAQVRVKDSDTFNVAGRTIRLFGIDAPEARDRNGTAATAALRRLIGGRVPTCARLDVDRYGRDVSLCTIAGRDLSLAMIQAGYAVAWCAYLRRQRMDLLPAFVRAETEARNSKRGMWARPFMPWRDYRCEE